MPQGVIQGFFIGGALPPGAVSRAVAQRARAQPARIPPGPPTPAFAAGAGGAAQAHGAGGNFEIDPVQLGLARSGGMPLPQAVLAKMEAAFGTDFSAVRIHVGPQAPRIGAIAFTAGDQIYFAPGRYQPESVRGQQLLGHELAHVVQQRQGRVRAPGSGMAVVQDRRLEAEADRLGMRAAMQRMPVQAKTAPGLHRPPLDLRAGAHGARTTSQGCGCGGGCGAPRPPRPAGAPALRRALVQRSAEVMGPTSGFFGGKRVGAPRKAAVNKGYTDRQLDMMFGSGSSTSASGGKKKDDCKGSRPAKSLKDKAWDGSVRSKKHWSAVPAGTMCSVDGCGNAADTYDHIVPYKAYIGRKANAIVICDGTCHFSAISAEDAATYYSDADNLAPICNACNGKKGASSDKKHGENVMDGPTPLGPCPNAPAGCNVDICGADVCL